MAAYRLWFLASAEFMVEEKLSPKKDKSVLTIVPLNMSLPAFAAERRRLLHGAPAPDRYILPTERRAANHCCCRRSTGQTDRLTGGL